MITPKNVCIDGCMVAYTLAQKFIFLHIYCITVNIRRKMQRPKDKENPVKSSVP